MGQLKIPTIASTDRSTSTWAAAELLYDSQQSRVYFGNGTSTGGVLLATGNPGAMTFSGGTSSAALGSVVFSNSNGLTFGLNGSTLTASHNGLTTAAASNHSHGNPTLALTNLAGTTASNSAGFTLSLSATAGLTTAAQSNHSHGNPTLALTNLAGTTASNSAGLTLSLSAAAPPTQATMFAVGNTTQSSSGVQAFSSLMFLGSGAASVGVSNGSVIVEVPIQTVPPAASFEVSGGTTNVSAASLSFGNSNNVNFGLSGATMTASAFVNVSAGSTSNNLSALTFGNANGLTFGLNASTLTASHNGLTTAAQSNHSHGNPTLALTNLAGTTASNSAGFTLSLSAAAPGGGGAVTFSGGTSSAALGSVVFSNSNGLTFGLNGSTMTASHNGLTTAAASNHSHGNPTLALTNLTGTTASNSAGLTLSLSGRDVLFKVSAGAQSKDLAAVTFADSNGISFGLNLSTITASHNGLTTAAQSNHSHGNPTLALTNLSGTTASASNGFTLSLSAAAPGGGGGAATLNVFNPWGERLNVVGQVGQASLKIQPMRLAHALSFDRVLFPIYYSNAAASSGSQTVSFWGGLYTKNGSTLSLALSWSSSLALTGSGTQGSYSLYSGGPRNFSIGLSTSIDAGDYWLGFLSRSTSGGAGASYSNFLVSAMASNFLGEFGVSTNATRQSVMGLGYYTVTSAGMPTSIGLSQINGTNSLAQRHIPVVFQNGTA